MRQCGADFLAHKLGAGGTCLHGLMVNPPLAIRGRAAYPECAKVRQFRWNRVKAFDRLSIRPASIPSLIVTKIKQAYLARSYKQRLLAWYTTAQNATLYRQTISSAMAEWPRSALCQSKSCQLLDNYGTKNRNRKSLRHVIDLECHAFKVIENGAIR